MSQLVAFYHIDTEAEFLLKYLPVDESSTVVGKYNPISSKLTDTKNDGTKPDIPWNSIVFIKDKGTLYYNLKYYGNDLYNLNNLIFKKNTHEVYLTGYSNLIIGNGDSDTLISNHTLKKCIINPDNTGIFNNVITLLPNTASPYYYMNCYPNTVQFLNDTVTFSDSIIQFKPNGIFDVSTCNANISTTHRISFDTSVFDTICGAIHIGPNDSSSYLIGEKYDGYHSSISLVDKRYKFYPQEIIFDLCENDGSNACTIFESRYNSNNKTYSIYLLSGYYEFNANSFSAPEIITSKKNLTKFNQYNGYATAPGSYVQILNNSLSTSGTIIFLLGTSEDKTIIEWLVLNSDNVYIKCTSLQYKTFKNLFYKLDNELLSLILMTPVQATATKYISYTNVVSGTTPIFTKSIMGYTAMITSENLAANITSDKGFTAEGINGFQLFKQ